MNLFTLENDRTHKEEVIIQLKLLLDNSKAGESMQTIIDDVKLDSFKFVITEAIKELEK